MQNATLFFGKLKSLLVTDDKSIFTQNGINIDGIKTVVEKAAKNIEKDLDDKKKEEIYQKAKFLLNSARDIPTCKNAQKLFLSISGYLDAEQCVASCQEKIDVFKKEGDALRLEQEKRKNTAKKTRKQHSVFPKQPVFPKCLPTALQA